MNDWFVVNEEVIYLVKKIRIVIFYLLSITYNKNFMNEKKNDIQSSLMKMIPML